MIMITNALSMRYLVIDNRNNKITNGFDDANSTHSLPLSLSIANEKRRKKNV